MLTFLCVFLESGYFRLMLKTGYKMLYPGVLIATLVVILTADSCSLPLQDEKIEPVDLNYKCIKANEKVDGETKSPILLVHGFGSNLESWKGVDEVLALRTGRRVCAIDLRNHGDSPWNNRTDILALVADIKHFLKKQKIEKVNIIGHSVGGKTTVHYTLTYPEQVDSIVVEDMRPNDDNVDKNVASIKTLFLFLREALESVPEGSNEAQALKIIAAKVNEKLKEIGEDPNINENSSLIAVRCTDGKCQYKLNIDIFIAALDDPSKLTVESKGLYEGPALFIYGKASDLNVGGDEENIRKLFPNAKLVGVDGAGHEIHGHFREFDDEVIKFLNK